MILADTSVWVEHFRRGNATLSALLEAGEIACHPFIIGELACGTLRNRAEILSLLSELPACNVAEHEDAMSLVESRRLMGMGIGWIDAHLLTSAVVDGVELWTLDRPLANAARICGVTRQ